MVITFFDHHGMVYINTVPQGHTINATYYISVTEAVNKKSNSKKATRSCQTLKTSLMTRVVYIVNEFLDHKKF